MSICSFETDAGFKQFVLNALKQKSISVAGDYLIQTLSPPDDGPKLKLPVAELPVYKVFLLV